MGIHETKSTMRTHLNRYKNTDQMDKVRELSSLAIPAKQLYQEVMNRIDFRRNQKATNNSFYRDSDEKQIVQFKRIYDDLNSKMVEDLKRMGTLTPGYYLGYGSDTPRQFDDPEKITQQFFRDVNASEVMSFRTKITLPKTKQGQKGVSDNRIARYKSYIISLNDVNAVVLDFFPFCSVLETKTHEFLKHPESAVIDDIRESWDWSDLFGHLPNFLESIGVDTKKLSPIALIAENYVEPHIRDRFETVFECLQVIFSKMYPTRATDVIDGKDPRRPTDHVLRICTGRFLNYLFPIQFSPPDNESRLLIPEIACCKCSENRHTGKSCTT